MLESEWESMKQMMIDSFQTIYGIDLKRLCEIDGIAKPMRFHVGYDAAGENGDKEYEFLIEVPETVYRGGTSFNIASYIVSCFKSELVSRGGLSCFPSPTDATAVWCDEI